MKLAIASLSILLAACNAPQTPAEPTPVTTPSSAQPAPQTATAAKRAPGDESPPMAIFRAFGTEPFWNVNVEDATLTFTTPEDQNGVAMQGERRSIEEGVEIAGNHDGKAFALSVKAGMCSDGMSDNQYELVSTFRYGDAEYKGCGEVAK